MKYLSIFLLTLLTTFSAWSQEMTFAQANKQYSEGNYDAAIAGYEELLNGKNHSASLYYNLGNAYFKQGNLANAILNYERAYRLAPSDKDIKANLDFAYTQIADKIDTPPRYFITKWVHSLSHKLHSNSWTYLGIAFWALLFLSLVLFIRTHSESKRKVLFPLLLISLFIALFSFYAAYSQYSEAKKYNYAIVFAQNITIKSTPSNNGTSLFILHEGTKVKILDKVGEWYKIQLTDNREGWLPSKKITKI